MVDSTSEGLLTFRIDWLGTERGRREREGVAAKEMGLVVWLLALFPYFLRNHVANSSHWREPGWVSPCDQNVLVPTSLET